MAVTTSAAWTISSVQGPRKLGDEVDADQDARLNGGRVDFGAGVPPTGLGTALIWGQVGATSQRHLRRPRRGCTGATRGVRFIAASSRRAIPGGVAMVAPATIARRMRNERNDVVKPPRREWGSAVQSPRERRAPYPPRPSRDEPEKPCPPYLVTRRLPPAGTNTLRGRQRSHKQPPSGVLLEVLALRAQDRRPAVDGAGVRAASPQVRLEAEQGRAEQRLEGARALAPIVIAVRPWPTSPSSAAAA